MPLVLAAFQLTATGSVRHLTKGEKRFWLLMVGLIAAYAAISMTRPSWVGQDDGLGVASLILAGDLGEIARYTLDVASRFTFTDPAMAAGGWGYLVAGALLLVYVAGLVAGNRAVRLGLVWWGVGCAFIYIVIWRDFGASNRYLYVPWAGLAVALGAAMVAAPGGGSVAPARQWAIRAVTGLALAAFVLLQGSHAREMQSLWQGYVDETGTARAQLLAAYPRIHPDTHFFAYRLPPVPDYIQSMASVWYGIPLNGFGGSWERLLKYGRATEHFYILDVDDGQLSNVYPELQAYRDTAFIWDAAPIMEIRGHNGGILPLDPGAFALDQIVGPPAERRLGLFMHPPAPSDGWASATYPVTVPQGSSLALGTFKEWGGIDGEDGLSFRVNFLPDAGGSITIFQESIDSPTPDWQRHEVDMSDYWGQTGRMQLQVSANGNLIHDHGYWMIPRFVSGLLEQAK